MLYSLLERNPVWESEQKVEQYVCTGNLIHAISFPNRLARLELATGRVSEERTVNYRRKKARGEVFKFNDMSGIGVFRDTLHLYNRSGWIGSFSPERLKFAWESRMHNLFHFGLAGDLVFSIVNNECWVFAWDRYSGKKTWQLEANWDPYRMLFSKNRLLLLSVDGRLACHSWKEPYASPKKGSDLLI